MRRPWLSGEVAELAEGGSLENCCGGNSTGGSNPPLSAKFINKVQLQSTEFRAARCYERGISSVILNYEPQP
jgi:hypothetical protein